MNAPSPSVDAAPNPGFIFDTLNAFQRSFALRGAIDLDLFTAIAKGHDEPRSLAAAVQGDERAVRILCDFLTVSGFLGKQGERYTLSPTAAVFLDSRSPQYLGKMVGFIHSPHLIDAFRDVAQVVRRGTTLLDGSGTVESEYDGWVDFARSMAPMMRPAAHFIAEWAARNASGPIRVLDIAAGHGLFGITVAQQNPHAQVVALDWGKVLAVAQENAEAAGVAGRFSQMPGDALQIDYGRGFDLVLLTNFLHHFDRPTCVGILRKVAAALADHGHVVTLEFVPNEDRVSPPVPATFSFTMLGTTPAGDAYTFAEYQSMWREVGFESHELHDVPNSAQRLIVSRRK